MLATRLMLFLVGIITVYSILPLVKNGLSYPPDPNLTRFPDMLYLMRRHFHSGSYLNIAMLFAAAYLYKLTNLELAEGIATTPSGICLSFPWASTSLSCIHSPFCSACVPCHP